MFLDVIVGVDEDLLPNSGTDYSELIGFIFVIVFIILVVIAIYLFTRPKLYPITVIRDENNIIAFSIYQQKNVYKIVNENQPKYQPATFKSWEDVVSFIKNETKDWDIEVDFLKK
mgnify:CR=1 FL=1|jgi:hypothetical protein